ncbi:unnamed protein product [Didymodactylos carnosus]|uniref:Peroxisomal ATPase PEX1 n=1 Tax=Didymodactylos carnosus TaxID=1234261 RepID=A0A813PQR3_9BILA|nr:unnamed protein product [Didymodactylos carnosus]CAF0752249.1 unnamed protein product [Didymodactylos carnosus]CAF3506424.1 unnamed protein product [Didymodactylos carnosus]CAF3532053.1 unnamed protein product [Didymodactylos carnosus]
MTTHILRCVYSKNRNCFLGINPLSFNTTKNASDFNVSTVRIKFQDNELYFSTIADYTLTNGQFSINGFFAAKINIHIEQWYEIEETSEPCNAQAMTFCPLSVDDWDILQCNTDVTEQVFLNQVRILWPNMTFPIWLSGVAIVMRVVVIEPSDIKYALISSTTNVTVVPEFREPNENNLQIKNHNSRVETEPILNDSPSLTTVHGKNDNYISYNLLTRKVGSFFRSQFVKTFNLNEKKQEFSISENKLTLVPGRNRHVFRVQFDDNISFSPTLVHINRNDWSSESNWPSSFVVKATVYRSSKEIKSPPDQTIPDHIPVSFCLIVKLIDDDENKSIVLKNHILLNKLFCQHNCIRLTDKIVISNTTVPPRQHCKVELLTQSQDVPVLLTKHYFIEWIRRVSTTEEPVLLSDNLLVKIDDTYYTVQLTNSNDSRSSDFVHKTQTVNYVTVCENNIEQYDISIGEMKELKLDSIEKYRQLPLIEQLYSISNNLRGMEIYTEHLLSIFELQLHYNTHSIWTDHNSLRNVLITGRSGSGRKTILLHCCQHLWLKHLIYYKLVDCLTFKGRKLENIVTSLTQYLDDMAFRKPSILILDHFDELCPNDTLLTDANIILATKKLCLTIRELFDDIQYYHPHFIIVVIVKNVSSINTIFTESIPVFFTEKINIEHLNSSQRPMIIEDIIDKKRLTIDKTLLSNIVNRTESFVIKDIQALIDNALLHLWMSFEDRSLQEIDFEYAFDEFKPINVKMLDTSKNHLFKSHWSDIGGMDHIKTELIQTVQWRFEHANYFSKSPIRLVSGILFYGPSGCGKTLLGQTLANECKVNFLQVKGPELLSKYVGSSEQNIRDLFNKARSVAPCMIMFDEFEALVPKRGRDSAGVTDRVVNQLLTELDGVEALGDIFIVAATSRPDLIDLALLRPGRLDKHIYIGFPTKQDLLSILRIWTSKIILADDVHFEEDDFLTKCEMYMGADIKSLIYNAQLAAFDEQIQSSTNTIDMFSKLPQSTKMSIVVCQRHFVDAMKQTKCSIPAQTRTAHEHFYQNWRKPVVMTQQTTSLA